jgi:hypothetical protein
MGEAAHERGRQLRRPYFPFSCDDLRSPSACNGSPARWLVMQVAAGGPIADTSALAAAHQERRDQIPMARSTFRVAPADVVKALLDCGEARFDHRLKFEVGEDIWPVLFDTFADEFTDIDGDLCPERRAPGPY